MPVITFTEDWSTISACESLTNFSGTGKTANFGLEQDGVKEGTYYIGSTPSVTTETIYGYDAVGGISLSANLYSVWIFTIPGFLNTYDNYGFFIRVSSSASSWTADYNDYKIGGNDVLWCEKGWHFVVLDANRSPDRSSGSCNLASVQRIGHGYNLLATASKVPVFGFDLMQYGTYVEVTGPSSSDPGGNGLDFNDNGASADTITRDDGGDFTTDGWESGDTGLIKGTANNNDIEFTVTTAASTTLTLPTGTLAQTDLNQTGATIYSMVTFEDILAKDNADTSYFGVVTQSPNGVWEINYNLILGDQSGAGDLWFVSRGEKLAFPDQPLTSATPNQTITIAEDTGETIVDFGYSSGTGDDRVGFGGSVIFGYNDQYGHTCYIDFTAAITELNVFGTTFLEILSGVDFSTDTGHLVTNCSFDTCGQIDLGSVEARNLAFSGYAGSTDAALLWNSNINIKNSRFLANANSSSDSAAIEHESSGSANYIALFFSGNDYDINFSAASGDLTISASQNADPSTYKVGGTGTVYIINTKTVSVHVEDDNGNNVQGAQVYIQKNSPTEFTSGLSNDAGDGYIAVTQAIDSDIPQAGWCLVYDISEGKVLPYMYESWNTSTFTLPSEVTGTANTGGSSTTLKRKTGDSFLTANIREGLTVRNTTDGSYAVVDEIVDADTIICSSLSGGTDNTWQENDAYSFHRLATTLISATDTIDVPILNDQTDASGDVSTSINYSSDVSIEIKVRKSSGGSSRYYNYIAGGTIRSTGFSTDVRINTDPIV
jgi:hypothetical protein